MIVGSPSLHWLMSALYRAADRGLVPGPAECRAPEGDIAVGTIKAVVIRKAEAGQSVGIEDFPVALVPEFLSLSYKLSWRGDREATADRMTEAEGESAAAAIRALYLNVLAAWTSSRAEQ